MEFIINGKKLNTQEKKKLERNIQKLAKEEKNLSSKWLMKRLKNGLL